MKNKVFQKASSLFVGASLRLGVLVAVLLLAASSSPAAENTFHEDSRHGNTFQASLVGAWVTSATLSPAVPPGFPSPTFQAIDTFYSDGTMIAVAQIFGVSIGTGVWKATGPDRFTFTFTFYRPDVGPDPSHPSKDPTTGLMLPVQVMENVLMTGKDSYVTTDTILPLDASGNPITNPQCGGPVVPPNNQPICAFPGIVKATRYQFAGFNGVLP